MEAQEQRSGAATYIVCTTLTPIAETYLNGMTELFTMWNTLREHVSSCDNISCQQFLHTEFNLLTFNDKVDINFYFAKLRDYQYNLKGTTLTISDGALVSKVLSTLPLIWRSQIRHHMDSQTATWVSIENFLRNIQAEQLSTLPASRAFPISKKGRKREKNLARPLGTMISGCPAPLISIFSVGIVPIKVIPVITAISRSPPINSERRPMRKGPQLRPPPL